LEAVNERFNGELQQFDNHTLKGDLHLGKLLSVLKATGLKDRELTIAPKTFKDHLDKHGLTTEDLKGLAKAIQKPILVYNWGKNHPATTVVTELETKDGRKITVGVRLENKGNNMAVNEIATVHGKTNDRLLEDWLKSTPEELANEKIKWVEKEKVLEWLGMAPPRGAALNNPTLNSIVNVIQNFENPKLSEEKSHESEEKPHVSDKKMQPVSQKVWERLIEQLKKTGLTSDVVIDESQMQEYLENY
jgi:hypothetical protein